MSRLAGARVLADPLAVDRIVDPMIAKNMSELADIGETGKIFQSESLLGEQGRDHQRQRGVLRPGNRNRPVQRRPAANLYAIHPRSLVLKITRRKKGRRPRPPPSVPRLA